MSRRKQANPRCVHLPPLSAASVHRDLHAVNPYTQMLETLICERCCAEFFKSEDLQQHQRDCSEDQLVIIVGDSGDPSFPSQLSFVNPSPAEAAEQTNDTVSDGDSEELSGVSKDTAALGDEEPMHVSINYSRTSGSLPGQETESGTSAGNSMLTSEYSTVLPQGCCPNGPGTSPSGSSNVFIENLEGTKVAVAQFAQNWHQRREDDASEASNPSANKMAAPGLVEQLLALQKQQVLQLKLIQQIRDQILLLASQGPETPVAPSACQGVTVLSLTSPLTTLSSHLSQQLLMAAGLAQTLANQSASISHVKKQKQAISQGSHDSKPVLALNKCSPVTEGHSARGTLTEFPSDPSLITSPSSPGVTVTDEPNSASKQYLPHNSPESHVFANPLPSISAIVEDLNALTALAQQRKGKLPNVTSLELNTVPSEEMLFKHKCKFCAKIFGSDSALQIHLRSHTGERPYKCNICGNRFSTRGNLKVHFQRHKDKYPNIQMNPYPVPEHLDNVMTSTGIPYGMSLAPETPASKGVDSKPTMTSLTGLLLPSTMSCFATTIKQEDQPFSITSASSTAFDDCSVNKLSEFSNGFTDGFREPSPKSAEKYSDVKHPLSFVTTEKGAEDSRYAFPDNFCANEDSLTPLRSEQLKTKLVFGNLLEAKDSSETSKLQQLVENINKKSTDPNGCVICHRVLSCQSALKMHYRTHTGERPFKCRVCGRAFTTKGNLKTHISIHRVIPPVKVLHSCPICQEKFTNAMVLQQHIRKHTGGQLSNEPALESPPKHMDSDSGSLTSRNLDDMGSLSDENMEITNGISESFCYEKTKYSSSSGNSPSSSPTGTEMVRIVGPGSQMRASEFEDIMDSRLCMMKTESLEGYYSAGQSSHKEDNETQKTWSPNSERTSTIQSSSSNSPPLVTTRSATLEGQQISPGETIGTALIQPSSDGSTSLYTSNSSPKDPVSLLVSFRDRGYFKNNVCDICNKTFACQSALDIHYRSHTKERPFVCTACRRGFSTKGNLKQHMLTHQMRDLPPRLFEPANQSAACFSYLSPLSTTSRLSSNPERQVGGSPDGRDGRASVIGPVTSSAVPMPAVSAALPLAPQKRAPKQHFCHACGKTFSSSSALQIHERTHTGEKPFACTICGRAFTTKGNLKVHMGTHMWSSSHARRGRRLSVDGPLGPFRCSPVKVPETSHKNKAGRVSNGESVGLWSQYAAVAVSNGPAVKTNMISVIQNGSFPHLSGTVGHGGSSPLGGLTGSLEKLQNMEISRTLPWLESVSQY